MVNDYIPKHLNNMNIMIQRNVVDKLWFQSLSAQTEFSAFLSLPVANG